MKREHVLLVVLALFSVWIASVGAVAPKFGDIPNPNGMMYGWDSASNTARALLVDTDGNLQTEATISNNPSSPMNVILRDSTGTQIGSTSNPITVSGTMTAELDVVGSLPVNIVNDITAPVLYASAPAHYVANLATNSVTLLSSVCSFTVPCVIKFNARGNLWTGDSDMASDTIQSVGEKWTKDEKQTLNPSSADWDLGMIADPAATSSMGIVIVPLVELNK